MKFTILLMLINMILNLKRHRTKTNKNILKFKLTAIIQRQEFNSLRLNKPSTTATNVPIYMEVNTEKKKIKLSALMKKSEAEQVIKNIPKNYYPSPVIYKLEGNYSDSKTDLTAFLFRKGDDRALYRLLKVEDFVENIDDLEMPAYKTLTNLVKEATPLKVDEWLKGHITKAREEAFTALKDKLQTEKNKPTSNISNVYDIISHFYLTGNLALKEILTTFIDDFNKITKELAAEVTILEHPSKFRFQEELKGFENYFEGLATKMKKESLRKKVEVDEAKNDDDMLIQINKGFVNLVSKLVETISGNVISEFKTLLKANFYEGQIYLFNVYFETSYLHVLDPTTLEGVMLTFARYVVKEQVKALTGQQITISCNDLIRFFKRLKDVLLPGYGLPYESEIGDYGEKVEIPGDTIVIPPTKKIVELFKAGFMSLPGKIQKVAKSFSDFSFTKQTVMHSDRTKFKSARKLLDLLVNSNKDLHKMAEDFINSVLVNKILDKQGRELSSLFELSIIKRVEINRECEIIASIISYKSINPNPNNQHSKEQRLPEDPKEEHTRINNSDTEEVSDDSGSEMLDPKDQKLLKNLEAELKSNDSSEESEDSGSEILEPSEEKTKQVIQTLSSGLKVNRK
jgi:hypothetical protein